MSNTFKDLVTLLTAEAVAKPVLQFAGDAAGAFFGQRSPGPTGPNVGEGERAGLGGAVRDAVYNAVTDQRVGGSPRGYTGSGVTKADHLNVEPSGTEAGKYITTLMKHSENPISDLLYSNPETTATVAGLAAPAAAAIGTGYLAGGLFGGSKPRSDYALAVQGNPYLGSTGNANIDAAQASAYYQQQTAQMKFEHQMQLQAMRQQAQTPGVQNTGASGVPGSIPGIDTDMNQIARSIYGTGLRL